LSDTEQLLADAAQIIELAAGGAAGSGRGRTITVTWFASTNPESWVVPWDCYLVMLNSNQATNAIYISYDGRTTLANPGLTGLGGGLLAAFVPNGTATSPWFGRSRIAAGRAIWNGGTSALTETVMVFELIE